jgi:hypothetical protein
VSREERPVDGISRSIDDIKMKMKFNIVFFSPADPPAPNSSRRLGAPRVD